MRKGQLPDRGLKDNEKLLRLLTREKNRRERVDIKMDKELARMRKVNADVLSMAIGALDERKGKKQ
jgi:hypothetical protein